MVFRKDIETINKLKNNGFKIKKINKNVYIILPRLNDFVEFSKGISNCFMEFFIDILESVKNAGCIIGNATLNIIPIIIVEKEIKNKKDTII